MEQLACPNVACRVAETGKCVEGFAIIGECPHQKGISKESLGTEQETNVGVEPEPVATKTEIKHHTAMSGSVLTIDEATDLLCTQQSRVITMIGHIESGKTTLALSLYEAFQNGKFDRWSFSGSLTFLAFEERSHLSRAASGREEADTPRTSLGDGLGFLHLALTSVNNGRIDFLLSERSGEFYSSVANSEEDCTDLYEVSRADYVLFIVDGEGLFTDRRHGITSEILMMMQTFVEARVLGKEHRVGIVLAKYDSVKANENAVRAETDFDNLVNTIRKRFGSNLAEITPFRVAARRKHMTVDLRYGVLNLLEMCCRPRLKKVFTSPSPLLAERSFHLLPVAKRGTNT